MMKTTPAAMMMGFRPKRSAVKKPTMQPKNAPAWNVDTILDDRAVSWADETVSRPNACLKEGRLKVPPMKAES